MSTSDAPATCGQGLAAHSALPARMADVLSRMGAVLDHHRHALDRSDAQTQPEHDVYAALVRDLEQVASHLAAAARRMTDARDLPMGRHDMDRMTGPGPVALFERFVAAERALVQVLQTSIADGEAMLQQMRGTPS